MIACWRGALTRHQGQQLDNANSTAYVIVCTITAPGVMAKDCVSDEERVR